MAREYWDSELETKPWAKVEAWQASRIAEFLPRLSTRSRFYACRLKSAAQVRAFDDLDSLPITRKDDLRRAQADSGPEEPLGANQSAPLRDLVQVLSSSGTTGQAMYYGLTRRDAANWADGIAAFFFTTGIRNDDVVAHLVGLPMVAGGLPYADGFRQIGATLAWLGGFPTERILAAIPRLRVSALLATTSFGVHLADHGRQLIGTEPSALGVKKFVSGGEPGLGQPEIRQKIRNGWGTSHVRECMGLGDVMSGMWAECEEGGGMHFTAQRYVAVELVDPESGARRAWQEGAEGETVYTTFDRDATPVLRYRSADHVTVTGTSCACGRTSPRIRCIGRTDEMLIYKGMNVFPTAIRDVVLTEFADVVEPYMRIWKERADQIRFDAPIPIEIECRPGLEPARLADLAGAVEAEIRGRLQVRVRVAVVAPGTIPRTAYKTTLVHVRPDPDRG